MGSKHTCRFALRITSRSTISCSRFKYADFSSYFAPELAVRSKRQITKGIDNEEAVEWKTVCVAPDQSVCSACFAKRANAARDQRSILARTALSLWFCLVAAARA